MLDISGLTLAYPGFLARYDLAVPEGALCALIGPSGGGKTTLLHALAGFEHPTGGWMRFRGQDLLPLSPAARPLTILFQDHNLLPHLTAAQNVGLGLDPGLRLTSAQWGEVEEALACVDLAGLGGRLPGQLSGGQRQRVALARALVRRRPLLLLDEPFGALDPGLRRDMLALVDTIRREQRLTVLLSLHTPEEARERADLMAFVAEGEVRRLGPPAALLDDAHDAALRDYLGR
jgi:thiamine transport system ATP-binding protein